MYKEYDDSNSSYYYYEYDDENNIIKKSYFTNYELSNYTLYCYNENNELVKELTYNNDGTLKHTYEYEYKFQTDGDLLIIKNDYYVYSFTYYNNFIQGIWYSINDSSNNKIIEALTKVYYPWLNFPIDYYMRFLYDYKNRLVDIFIYDCHVSYNCEESDCNYYYEYEEDEIEYYWTYEYDGNNNLIKESKYYFDINNVISELYRYYIYEYEKY